MSRHGGRSSGLGRQRCARRRWSRRSIHHARRYEAIDARDAAERALAAAEEREDRLRAELERQQQMRGDVRQRAWADIGHAADIASVRGRRVSQELEALGGELYDLRGQSSRARHAVWRALRVVRRAQRERERELKAQVEALQAERGALLRRFERAKSQAQDTERRQMQDLSDVLLRVQAELAHAGEEREAARAEAFRRAAGLARLVEEQSTRIARLGERSVLSEAGDVLAAALGRLSR
ncbi:hypothetical protein ACFVXW_33250 [Streptomyces sp. NPDC058251]|uniref:hypothetical protein n=1 Tax=Streptomyces sp. NPDC058251 TaxID=3346404 RepID=UPI0036E1B45B